MGRYPKTAVQDDAGALKARASGARIFAPPVCVTGALQCAQYVAQLPHNPCVLRATWPARFLNYPGEGLRRRRREVLLAAEGLVDFYEVASSQDAWLAPEVNAQDAWLTRGWRGWTRGA